jgi:gas vesicle protein
MEKENGKIKILEGALVGAVLGVAAGLLLAPKSGAKLRKDIENVSADFYDSIAPEMKKLGKIGEKEYKTFVKNAAESYAKAKKLSTEEAEFLAEEAQSAWKHLQKHF